MNGAGKESETRADTGAKIRTDHDPASSSPDTVVIRTESREQTVALGCRIGARLTRGAIVCLDGDLGAGKTALTAGLAEGVGCRGPVASPTFTLLIEHEAGQGGLPLYHFDVYRLSGEDDFLDLGFDEYLSGDGVCVIEWSSRIRQVLPAGCLQIELTLADPERPDERIITLRWPGQTARLQEIIREDREGISC